MDNSELANGNIFAYVAAQAAYENGTEWLNEMVDYIQRNVDYVVEFLKNNVPQIKPMNPQASFLIWLDCAGLEMNSHQLQEFMVIEAQLGLNQGTTFGPGGELHLRLNIGCSREVLKEAMERLRKAVDNKLS